MKTLNRILLAAWMLLSVALSVPASAAVQNGPVYGEGQESHGGH